MSRLSSTWIAIAPFNAALVLTTIAMTLCHGALNGQTLTRSEFGTPAPRSFQGMAYDPIVNASMMFGGAGNDSLTFGDTWIWRGNWFLTKPSVSPSSRQGLAMAYDGNVGNVVLFGGCSDNSPSCTYYNDTWTWDGKTWTEIYPSSVATNRYNLSLNYEPDFQVLLMFGGFSTAEARGGTWLLEIAP